MFKYAIIGSGKQGTASAYDLIKFGNAEKVLLIDNDLKAAEKSAKKLNKLTNSKVCVPLKINVKNKEELLQNLTDIDSIISGVPYYFNLELTKIAIQVGANFFDFGGNTDVVKSQLSLNNLAKENNISVVPDCGMDPGMNISFIQYLFENYDELITVKSYGAGLMQFPKAPWNYELSFHINGLTNEYYGDALFIRKGKVVEVPTLTDYEILEFPKPLGKLEAVVTSGGLSTLPYELEEKVETLENKTLRYLGHWGKFKAFKELGLFEETSINVNGKDVVPREVYHHLLTPKITSGDNRDLGIIKILANGIKDGKEVKTTIELIDYFDEVTGFTAMQRLTGWHASTMAILAAENKITKGAVSVSKAISGKVIIDELIKRGIKIIISEN
ncbi:MAG: saccharopine dehydrogenase NADP-binding domain-containing protein [Ignavibacteriales bacterium]|nr:saccharopine dehydrogenase NADP-binding domain-containing protein [Ignavibacteriales bacterium]